MIEHATAQKRRATKARALKKAEREVDCFCIAWVRLEPPLVADTRRCVNAFYLPSAFLAMVAVVPDAATAGRD